MTTATVQVLNVSFEPLGVTPINRAMRLLVLGKAVVHEADETRERLREWAYPKVIRLVYYIKRNYKRLYGKPDFSKHGVLKRDTYKCAYCGGKATTIDHILPKCRGGPNTFENTVAACFDCNNKKDNRTPQEAGMPLLFKPYEPTKAQLMGR